MPATNAPPVIKAPWKPHKDREARMASAVEVARMALAAEEVMPQHRARLLSQAIWWYTECDGKFTTRYRTEQLIGEAVVPIRHEHVVQRKGQILRMLAEPEKVDEIMASSLACLVSTAEHDLLKPFDDLDGWPRYAAAGITVLDMADGSVVQAAVA